MSLRLRFRAMLISFLLMGIALSQTQTQVLERVEQVSGISNSGPFRLSAGLYKDKKRTGSYELLWGNGFWQDEVSWGNFSERRIGNKGGIYIARSSGGWLPEVFHLRELIPVSYSSWAAASKKIQRRKMKGKEVLCVEFDDLRRSQMCFQESDGTIAGNNIYSFSDFRPFEGKTVPRKIASDEITIVVESLDKVERLALPAINSDFKGPFDGCYQPAIPLLQDSTVHPRYPQEAKSARIQGESYVYAAIDSSGSVSATLSLAGSQPVFAATSKAAVQYWRYAPAKCGDTAVPYERVETIHFTLSGG